MTNKQLQDRLDELKTILAPRRGETLPAAAQRLIQDLTAERAHTTSLTVRLRAAEAIHRAPDATPEPADSNTFTTSTVPADDSFITPERAGLAPAPANPSNTIIRVGILTISSDAPPPPVAPDLGDLTPEFTRWALRTQPLEVCRELYADRERDLPEDVRAALKGGA